MKTLFTKKIKIIVLLALVFGISSVALAEPQQWSARYKNAETIILSRGSENYTLNLISDAIERKYASADPRNNPESFYQIEYTRQPNNELAESGTLSKQVRNFLGQYEAESSQTISIAALPSVPSEPTPSPSPSPTPSPSPSPDTDSAEASEEAQVNAMNGLTKFFIKIILIFAAGFVPIIMGDKLAGGIQGAVDKFSKRARDTAYKTSRLGAYQEGRARAKMQNAAAKYNINRGKLGWRNPVASSQHRLGKAIEKSGLGSTRAGAMLSSRLTSGMQDRIGIGWAESEKIRKSRPYSRDQSLKQLRHANLEKRRDAILDLATRGDLDFMHAAFDPADENHQLAQSVLRDVSVGIGGRGDGEMFAALKDNNPDALIAASLHTMSDEGTRRAITRSGGNAEKAETTLMKQGQAAMYSMQPDKYNKWASASMGNLASLSTEARKMAGSGTLDTASQGKAEEIGGYFGRYLDPTRAEYQVYSRDVGQKGGRNALFDVDKKTGSLLQIKDSIYKESSPATRAVLQHVIDNQDNPAAHPTDLVRPDGYDPAGQYRAQEDAAWTEREGQRAEEHRDTPRSWNSEEERNSWRSNEDRGGRDNFPRR